MCVCVCVSEGAHVRQICAICYVRTHTAFSQAGLWKIWATGRGSPWAMGCGPRARGRGARTLGRSHPKHALHGWSFHV